MNARNSDPHSSHEAAEAVEQLAGKLRARIVPLVRATGTAGATQSEIAAQMAEYKQSSITPRFIELIERKLIVRVLVGFGKRTRRYPNGVPRYITRFDPVTKHNVTLYWFPGYEPKPPQMSLGLENALEGEAAA